MHTKGFIARRHLRLVALLGKLICLLLLANLLAGCGLLPASQPTATQPPPPTNTPQPTATDRPTNTPEPTATNTPIPPTDTPVPTPTVDRAATEAAQMTEAAAAAETLISADLAKFDIPLRDGQLVYLQDKEVSLSMTSYGEMVTEEMENSYADDFILYTEITWESKSGLAGCGIVFRSEDDIVRGDQYRFFTMRLSGAPLWDIEWWTDGLFTYGWGVQSTSSIDVDQSAANEYLLVATGSQVAVYANGNRIGSINDNRRDHGNFGYFGFHESGETTCSFENTWVWQVEEDK